VWQFLLLFQHYYDNRLQRAIKTGALVRLWRENYRVLVSNAEVKRPLDILRCRWEDNIKMCVREIGWEVVDWIFMTEEREGWWTVVNTVINLRVPRNVGNNFKIWEMIRSSIKALFTGVIYLARFNKGKVQKFDGLTEWEILKCGRQSSCSSRWHSKRGWLQKENSA
jgi:hypothetical protein